MRRYDRIKAVVSLDAIAHNFGEMKKNIAKGTKIIAVIKADGYGHGAEAIARLITDTVISGDLQWLPQRRLFSFVPLG